MGAMTYEVSVVIPTFNRLEVLAEVLQALEFQQGAPPFEVVVVDDGSSDGTSGWLRSRTFNLPLRALTQENRGPAAARNTGVAVAQGQWVAFLGDDTVPSSGWLAAHREAHRRHGDDLHVAVLGYTGWHPRMQLNPFLRYINEHGLQFGYALIDDPEDVPFNFFYTSNISLSRDILLAEPFDLRFPYAAWEDIEVAYRMKKRGLRMVYEKSAIVAHDHPTDLGRFAARQERAGFCAVVFYRLHPGARTVSRSRPGRSAAGAAGRAAEVADPAGPRFAKSSRGRAEIMGGSAPLSLCTRSSPRLERSRLGDAKGGHQ